MRRDASSHFLDLPFLPFFFLLLFLRPPGMTGFIAGGLVGDGDGAEASVVVAAAAGASAAGAGASVREARVTLTRETQSPAGDA